MALSSFNHKSSVLCPETTHFTSQYLALEQIEAHYKMIAHAKHNLDMSTPKSMKSYIGNMSEKKKNLWTSSEISPRSQHPNSFDNMSEVQSIKKNAGGTEKYDEDKETIHTSLSLNKSIQAGNPYPLYNSKIADKISWYLEAVNQGEFQTSSHSKNFQNSGNDHYGSHISLSSSLRSRKIIKGDLIEWHKSHFTSDKHLFSPRILANNHAKSKVRDMRCYNPPQQKSNDHNEESSDTFESDDDDGDSEMDEGESESDEVKDLTTNDEIKDMTLKDDNELIVNETIVDNKNWMGEQGLKIEVKHEFNGKFKEQQNWLNSLRLNAQVSNVKSSPSLPFNKHEDDDYLKFLINVTEDILKSGIYSDRAIQQTFEFHLQFCPENNDKEKLKQVLNQMLEGLKILSDDTEDVFSERHNTIRKDNLLSTSAEKQDINSRNNFDELQSSFDNNAVDTHHHEYTTLYNSIDANSQQDAHVENEEIDAS